MMSVLAACGGAQEPQSLPTIAPIPPPPVNASEENPQSSPVVIQNPIGVNGKILFVNNDNNGGNIVIVEGTSSRRLTTSGKKYQPAWSPDGKRIAYVQREESFADIWVMNADGSRKIQVTNNEPAGIDARSPAHVRSVKWAFYPAWSPSGALLAYVSQLIPPRDTGNSEVPQEYPLSLYLYGTRRIGNGEFAGDSFQRLVKSDTDLNHPTWAPADSLVVYAQAERCYTSGCSATLTLGFYVPASDTATEADGVLQGARPDTFANAFDPQFSPDGKWLAYAKREAGATDAWIAPAPDATGLVRGAPVKLTDEGRVRMPTWSPDGKQLAYFVLRDNLVSLTVADVTGSGAAIKLENKREVRKDPIDVDSGMSWVR